MNDHQKTGVRRRPTLLASKPFLFALALLSVCTIVLFFLEYGREKDRALQAVQGRISERVNALDRTISSMAMNVNLMKRWSESHLEKGYSDSNRPNPEDFIYDLSGEFFQLPQRQDGEEERSAGNVLGTGKITGRDRRFYQELNLAVTLLPLLQASRMESPALLQSYFISNEGISATSPYVSAWDIIANAAPGGNLKEAFDLFYEPHDEQHLNPERRGYWTDVYRDRSGQGLMVTYAAPVYVDDRQAGIVAADITLSLLEDFAEQVGALEGRQIVVASSGKVLVDSAPPESIQKMISVLEETVPAPLRESVQEMLQGDAGTFFRRGGHYVFSRRLTSAPWVFINVLDEGHLSAYLSMTRITFSLTAVMLTSLLLLSWLALRHMAVEEALGESERKYQEVFNATGEAIFIQDAQSGVILDVNHPMLDMYGYSRDEALRLSVNDLSSGDPPYSQAEAERFISSAVGGKPQVFEWMARRRDGKLFWVEVALTSSFIGGHGRILAVVRDVSDRKRLEKENLEFKDKVIEEMKNHEEYVSEVAHRLRNPLQVLMGHLEHFETANLTPDQRKSLEALHRSLEKIASGVKKLT